jgi:hypothetical protein
VVGDGGRGTLARVDGERFARHTTLARSAAGGSGVRIHQPQLPPATWRVTELNPGAGFTWVSVAPGVRVTARHTVEAIAMGSRVTLSIHYEGLLGAWLARWTGDLNERYLAMEANGLRAHCIDLAAKPYSRTT